MDKEIPDEVRVLLRGFTALDRIKQSIFIECFNQILFSPPRGGRKLAGTAGIGKPTRRRSMRNAGEATES